MKKERGIEKKGESKVAMFLRILCYISNSAMSVLSVSIIKTSIMLMHRALQFFPLRSAG
jgi:hypothetical protein